LGGPDGGNGGKGGDVFFVADPHANTLLDITYRPHFKAGDGNPGGTTKKYGRGAEDLIIKLPIGTVVYRDGEPVVDLKEAGQQFLAGKGGRGGRGNTVFKTQTHTAPRIAEKGEPGETATYELELKLIADIGLVGFPNAGKSTLLSRVSSAHPKIADYPFTTLSPNLGVVTVGEQNFVVADIPGLIEGAHEGRGLGDEFLRHIQRTHVLIHIVDLFGFDGQTAYKNFKTINKELSEYSKKLAEKPMVIAANKTDLTGAGGKLAEFKKRLKGKKVYPISAVSGEGIKALISEALKKLKTEPADRALVEEPVRKYIYERDFTVTKENDIFVVSGKKIERLAAMTDFNGEETLRRFQNIIKKMGIEKSLLDHGIRPGDTVRIGDEQLIFQK
jgi:GTP-binding protein